MKKKPKKNSAAVALGKLGAKARLQNLTPKQRSDQAKKAVQARWHKGPKATALSNAYAMVIADLEKNTAPVPVPAKPQEEPNSWLMATVYNEFQKGLIEILKEHMENSLHAAPTNRSKKK